MEFSFSSQVVRILTVALVKKKMGIKVMKANSTEDSGYFMYRFRFYWEELKVCGLRNLLSSLSLYFYCSNISGTNLGSKNGIDSAAPSSDNHEGRKVSPLVADEVSRNINLNLGFILYSRALTMINHTADFLLRYSCG